MIAADTDKIVEQVMEPICWPHQHPDDWQYYIGHHTQRVWNSLSLCQRIALALDAIEVREARL